MVGEEGEGEQEQEQEQEMKEVGAEETASVAAAAKEETAVAAPAEAAPAVAAPPPKPAGATALGRKARMFYRVLLSVYGPEAVVYDEAIQQIKVSTGGAEASVVFQGGEIEIVPETSEIWDQLNTMVGRIAESIY